MFPKPHDNAVVLQSGGPTAVINASLFGVQNRWVETRRQCKIFGSKFGIKGLICNNLVDITRMYLSKTSRTPSASLGTTRHSLRNHRKKDIDAILENLKKHEIGHVFIIGGDDSRENTFDLTAHALKRKHPLQVIHIPKTVDNDLTHTHHCPGYASAAQFIVWAVKGIDLDNRALPGVAIDVVMGRDTGWLAAASVLAQSGENCGPHFIYTPEMKFNIDKFLSDVVVTMRNRGRVHIVVSEGIAESVCVKQFVKKAGLERLAARLGSQDDFGHIQLSGTGLLGVVLSYMVKTELKIKRVRSNPLEYPQRSFPIQSEADYRQAVEVGTKAVDFDAADLTNIMVALGDSTQVVYNHDIFPVDLDEVFKKGAETQKQLPKRMLIDENGINLAEFRAYIGPMVDLPRVSNELLLDMPEDKE